MARSSVIRFLNVPFDNTYRNVLDMGSALANKEALLTRVVYEFSEHSFAKKNNTIRVSKNKDELMSCNYVMWNNGIKDFYGFITDIKYLAPESSEVTIEIDGFQTYWYDGWIGISFIEREHVSDDNAGNYTLDENLPLGEYKYNEIDVDMRILTDYRYIVGSLYDRGGNEAKGDNYCGVPSGIGYFWFERAASANSFVWEVTQKKGEEAIQFIALVPKLAVSHCYNNPIAESNEKVASKDNANTYGFTINVNTDSIDGYTPKNKKCLIYPYQSIYVTNNEGLSNDYLIEHFGSPSLIGFRLYCNTSANTEVVLYPQAYKNANNLVDEGLSLNNYPQIAFSIDTYKYWLACNIPALAFNLTGNVLAGASINPTVGGLGAISSLTNFATQEYQHSISPLKAIGNTAGSANASAGLKKFSFYKKEITKQYIQAIDNYFERYGYRVDRMGVPNCNTRPHWNYVKLRDAVWDTKCPSNIKEKVLNAFNTTGVTLWHNLNFQFTDDNH